jgi:hypothetical protein
MTTIKVQLPTTTGDKNQYCDNCRFKIKAELGGINFICLVFLEPLYYISGFTSNFKRCDDCIKNEVKP